MNTKYVLALSLGLFMAATSAWAFSEEKPAAPGASSSAPSAGVGTQDGAAQPAQDGTQVNIPGLGNLGTLPKMDFGLELLYGANEGKPAEAEPANPAATPEQEDLTIRGTMKHNF
ncbi:MAG: hypothetical protein Q7T86_02630 [Hyphomicrobiaceae bacterium]|nr:hypothetical protein [Hyphomicrobiaceae bacterium]